jgi:hypothetical protein
MILAVIGVTEKMVSPITTASCRRRSFGVAFQSVGSFFRFKKWALRLTVLVRFQLSFPRPSKIFVDSASLDASLFR